MICDRISNIKRTIYRLHWLCRTDFCGFLKSVYLCYKFLPFAKAKRIPVFISGKTTIGEINKNFYDGPCISGVLSFGLIDRKYTYPRNSLIRIKGKIIVKGSNMHAFGPGCVVDISENAKLIIENNFAVSCGLHLSCNKEIYIGENNMWSYDIDIRDTDGHPIFDGTGHRINNDAPIKIGSDVWIGSRCQILKGVNIVNQTIIAASSVVAKSQADSFKIITSNGRIIKDFVCWKR